MFLKFSPIVFAILLLSTTLSEASEIPSIQEFDVDPETASADVTLVLKDLVAAGLCAETKVNAED